MKLGITFDHQAKVSQFVSSLKNWILDSLKEILPDDIINSISFIPIPTKNVRDEMISNDGQFSMKTATYADNETISPHFKAKILNRL